MKEGLENAIRDICLVESELRNMYKKASIMEIILLEQALIKATDLQKMLSRMHLAKEIDETNKGRTNHEHFRPIP